ncbi:MULTISPECIES: hypothetical protein [unclassified Micromonospora]|uniref:hypothetical protein n=1 Tax=unclassified Micromonospora TaxID=2617518 RepID=UPI00362D2F20
MSLVEEWERGRAALAARLAGTTPLAAGELLRDVTRGLVRPYSDRPEVTPLQAAYAAYALDTLALAPLALLNATTTTAAVSEDHDVRFAQRRPAVGEAVLWLSLITVVSAILTVVAAYALDPILAGLVGVVAILGIVGTSSTLVKVRPDVASFIQRYGRRAVPRTLRWMLRLVPARAAVDADPPPEVALTTQVTAADCVRWLDHSMRAVDRMLGKLVGDDPTPHEWLADENTAHAVQELLDAVIKNDAKRCQVAAGRLAAALTAEGVVAVMFDDTNREFFDTAPSGRSSAETLRPALVQHQPTGLALIRRGLVAVPPRRAH